MKLYVNWGLIITLLMALAIDAGIAFGIFTAVK